MQRFSRKAVREGNLKDIDINGRIAVTCTEINILLNGLDGSGSEHGPVAVSGSAVMNLTCFICRGLWAVGGRVGGERLSEVSSSSFTLFSRGHKRVRFAFRVVLLKKHMANVTDFIGMSL